MYDQKLLRNKSIMIITTIIMINKIKKFQHYKL
ncbi:unnamed protein product [Schistosoma mattheei]|uniref:Uncharacterized protein n=1 Tax=Schistosoma mattheei TaxID=31246 RepID=A0A3P8L2K4_9TREM|nr:unnamed protein product [Schistosoma mattheei]